MTGKIPAQELKGAIDAQVEATFERVEALYRQLHLAWRPATITLIDS